MNELRVIDVHTHLTPQRYIATVRTNAKWHGLSEGAGEVTRPRFCLGPEERLAEMDEIGIDMQLVSPTDGFYQYGNDLDTTKAISRDCNDEIAELVNNYPDRFVGMGTLPMQDVPSAIAELERSMTVLGLKGAMISDHVLGRTYDEAEFLPFWKAAEAMGAIIFFHQGKDTIVNQRLKRYYLENAVGNLTERALVYGALVFGGVIDKHPDLKLLLAHAGGYTAFGIDRMDKVAGALEGDAGARARGYVSPIDDDVENPHRMFKAPSEYLGHFYFDSCTFTAPALRFLIDIVGIDHVVLGTDYPAPMIVLDAVNWINGLDCLNAEEKKAILSRNPARLLGIDL